MCPASHFTEKQKKLELEIITEMIQQPEINKIEQEFPNSEARL